jgi:hypothetical protein
VGNDAGGGAALAAATGLATLGCAGVRGVIGLLSKRGVILKLEEDEVTAEADGGAADAAPAVALRCLSLAVEAGESAIIADDGVLKLPTGEPSPPANVAVAENRIVFLPSPDAIPVNEAPGEKTEGLEISVVLPGVANKSVRVETARSSVPEEEKVEAACESAGTASSAAGSEGGTKSVNASKRVLFAKGAVVKKVGATGV